ncbi:MAG: PDZ domain-containing protein [Desulfamplus sp.]|nr:PDZ domain-containing protein [Desulfamplus sp.]
MQLIATKKSRAKAMGAIVAQRAQKRDRAKLVNTTSSWRVYLFVLLLLFLIAWAFFGDRLEKRVYGEEPYTGKIGAEIVLSYSGGGGASQSHLIVGQVMPNSPAQRSGLKTGDKIVGLDGHIISSPDMATQILSSKKVGDTLKITVLRDNRQKDIHIHLPTMTIRDKSFRSNNISRGVHFLAMLMFLKLTVVLFLFIYKNIEIRMHAVLVASAIVVMVGSFLGIYYPVDAFFSIKFNTISLLLGMYIISTTLDQAGFFDYVAYQIYQFSGTDRTKIFIMFCIITYLFSLLVNNLTTILVMVPMTLNLAARIGFDPRPVVIGEIIASNIGGASTMIGDFPNMLIASEAGVGFNQFIIFMMPICMILFGIMLFYLKSKLDYFDNKHSHNQDLEDLEEDEGNEEDHEYEVIKHSSVRASTKRLIAMPKLNIKETKTVKRALFILFHMLVLFSLSDLLSLNPSAIALTGGLSVFLFSGMDKNALVKRISFNDVLFFTGLFIIVGGLEASGGLKYVTQFITQISMGTPWLCCLILMWVAALFTAFLSAGPTTALFFPVVAGIGIMPANHIMWWSLSLGVLAGSSATITGATAGPVATTLVENFNTKYRFKMGGGIRFTFSQFSGIGIPIAIIFLIISSCYIFLLNMA